MRDRLLLARRAESSPTIIVRHETRPRSFIDVHPPDQATSAFIRKTAREMKTNVSTRRANSIDQRRQMHPPRLGNSIVDLCCNLELSWKRYIVHLLGARPYFTTCKNAHVRFPQRVCLLLRKKPKHQVFTVCDSAEAGSNFIPSPSLLPPLCSTDFSNNTYSVGQPTIFAVPKPRPLHTSFRLQNLRNLVLT